MTPTVRCFVLLAFASPLALAAQSISTLDPALQARIDRIAQQVLDQTGVPSASVAVVQHGKLAYTHAYGSARLATATTPAIPASPQGCRPTPSPPPPSTRQRPPPPPLRAPPA